MNTVIAIDPGRDKCGVAVRYADGTFCQAVIATDTLCEWVRKAHQGNPSAQVIMGNGTSSREIYERICRECNVTPLVVEEYKTTELARKRYWQENPPQGLRRLLPTSMQVPPVPVDGYVAVILAERYANQKEGDIK